MRETPKLILVLLLFVVGVLFAIGTEFTVTFLVVLIPTIAGLAIFRRYTEEKTFITKLFLFALALRLLCGAFIHVFDLRDFFGSDSLFYDKNGELLVNLWYGQAIEDSPSVIRATSLSIPGWGMNYFVGGLYLLIGRNILAAQSLCAVFGAATAPLMYFCAQKIYGNRRVSRISSVAVAVFPALVIWSSQLLKDGLIVFLLVLAMIMVMHIQTKLDYMALAVLGFSLFGILSLRFYIFYMVMTAVVGAFFVGVANSNQSIVRRTVMLVILGVGLTYFGVIRTANLNLEEYGSLERIELSRGDLANSADSGYGSDLDVSTPAGALIALPIGFVFLIFAPFPWEGGSFRQLIVIPETLVWWSFLPIIVMGLIYTIRHRLRNAFPILTFTLMLTLAYSIFQGNVGTAYRQRTQIQVFLFIFFAVGIALFIEKRNDRRELQRAKLRRMNGHGYQPISDLK